MINKRTKLIALLLTSAVCLSSCGSLLPSSDNPNYTGDGPNEQQQEADAARREKTLRTVESILRYDRAEAQRQKEEEERNKEENRPLTAPSPEYTDLVIGTAKDLMREFLADYSSERYRDNMGNRALKTVLNGLTGETLNGGYITDKESEKAGYWRVANCTYYNVFFFTDGTENTARVLFKADMYHYTLKENENLAETTDPTDLTTENSEIGEHGNSFLVVAIDSVSQANLNEYSLTAGQVRENVLFFEDYDSAAGSFASGELKAEDWRIPDGYGIQLLDGYIGKPIVPMPELVGRFIDISAPENVKELDDLGITNYTVKWIDNDGSMVAYSIVSCSKDPGTLVDITDTARESTITVEVAKKAS